MTTSATMKSNANDDLQRYLETLRWKWGGPRIVWEGKAELLEKIIHTEKLTTMTAEWATTRQATTTMSALPIWEGLAGGIRLPHFHFRGDIYRVTPSAWKTFTTEVMKEASAKLDAMKKAEVVPFENAVHAMEMGMK